MLAVSVQTLDKLLGLKNQAVIDAQIHLGQPIFNLAGQKPIGCLLELTEEGGSHPLV